jgi:hypothetical protein
MRSVAQTSANNNAIGTAKVKITGRAISMRLNSKG